MNTKKTPELLKEIKRLYNEEHWDYKKIAKKHGLALLTIRHWVNDKKAKSHKSDGIGDHPERIPLFIRQNLEDAKSKIYPKDKCQLCGKEKEGKFELTNFCSLECFKNSMS